MKKLILSIALLSTGLVHAQVAPATESTGGDMVSKRGTPILPQAKDWSIGFDAKPVFDYFGNMFNNSTHDSLYAGFQHPLIIVGKYFKDANTAYRGMVRIGYSILTDNAFIVDQNSQVAPFAHVTDTRTTSETNIVLGFGMQKYRGKGRLKGYYGYEGNLLFGGKKQTFDYGNELNSINTDPSLNSTNFGALLGDTANGTNLIASPTQARVTEFKAGSSFGIGVRGYLGIEWFFAAKFSIGAEYGWGISLMTEGEGETITQSFNNSTGVVDVTTEKTGKHSSFGFDNDNLGGGIFLSAYF